MMKYTKKIYKILNYIKEKGEIIQYDLFRDSICSMDYASILVNRLEENGLILVERKGNKKNISLSPKGIEALNNPK